jgi:glycosyltransferase involved in cell wall biosynthesis
VRTVEGYPNTSPATLIGGLVDQKVFRIDWPAKLGRSSELSKALASESAADVYHLHGAWLRAMYYGYREAKQRHRPYIIQINGAYQPYELNRKSWRKRLVRKWFQDRILEEAFCLHVNSILEAQQIRAAGFKKPIVVIPAGFRIPSNDIEFCRPRELKSDTGPFFLYLARIHPNKGIELLLRGWAELAQSFPEIRLIIAGGGEPDYVSYCLELIRSLGLVNRCEWLGFVSEAEKSWLLAKF